MVTMRLKKVQNIDVKMNKNQKPSLQFKNATYNKNYSVNIITFIFFYLLTKI